MGDVKYFGLRDVSCGFSAQGSLYTTFFEGCERFGESLSLPCFCQVKKRPLGQTVSASQKKTEATGRRGMCCGVGLQKEETEVL